MVRARDEFGRFVSGGGSSVTDIDRGFKDLERNVRSLIRGPNVTIGVQGVEAGEVRALGMTNASLAALHEFGSRDGTIPQRSFLRGTIDRERSLVNRLLTRAAKNAAGTGRIKQELGIVGEKVRAEVIRTIDQSIDIVANADSTIAKKGSTTPLIDTGVLKQSISWKVNL